MQWFASSQLKSKNPRRRMEALGRIADARDRQSVAAVMSALGDSAVEVRLEALNVIVRWRDENTVRALTHVTRDPHPEVRERAISELGALGLRESIPTILPCLCDMAMPVRTAAVQALNILGWMSVTPGERALESIGRSQFAKAAALGRASLELLLPFVDHAAATTRRDVAEALGLIRDPQAATVLQKLMGDIDPSVRIAALAAMAASQQPVAIIARGIADPDKNVRLARRGDVGRPAG